MFAQGRDAGQTGGQVVLLQQCQQPSGIFIGGSTMLKAATQKPVHSTQWPHVLC